MTPASLLFRKANLSKLLDFSPRGGKKEDRSPANLLTAFVIFLPEKRRKKGRSGLGNALLSLRQSAKKKAILSSFSGQSEREREGKPCRNKLISLYMSGRDPFLPSPKGRREKENGSV